MKFLLSLLFIFSTSIVYAGDSLSWIKKESSFFTLHYTSADSTIVNNIQRNLWEGNKTIAIYFSQSFAKKFDVYVFPNRKELDEQWSKDWAGAGFKSQCWMVASGVANRLDLLSPLSWKQETCDHNPNDSIEIQKIIAHELVHVFHAQQNPRSNFDGMDDLSWLVEGLATFVSGQLTNEKLNKVRTQLIQKIPAKLSELWTGADKYGRVGSFMQFLDQKYGKEKILKLLSFTDLSSILEFLHTDEASLITEWKNKIVG
jgi:hypothetical protein